MASQFKKGQEVYRIRSWNGEGVFYIQRLTVESFGKRQATLRTTDGHMLRELVYADRYELDLFPCTIDAEAKALEMATAFAERELQLLMRYAFTNTNTPGYVRCMVEKMNALKVGVITL